MRNALLAAALALASCQHRSPPARDVVTPAVAPRDAQGGSAEARDATAPTADAPSAQEARLMALADELAASMSRLRGLAPRGPIDRGVMSRDQIVARLRARTRAEYPPGEMELEGELYRRLGMIPESLDYERAMFDLLEEQVMGFYDPIERRLYIADWVPAAVQPGTMAHEVTHALQDQHFDIGRFVHHARGQGDAQAAAMAVVEGDATAAMLDLAMAPMGRRVRDLPDPAELMSNQLNGPGQERLMAAPRALRETMLFPYVSGLAMVARALREGEDFRGVDALLARPPASTEQVLHADKLASREAPIDVPAAVPAPLAGRYALAYQDVLGELGARLFFNSVLDDARSDAAAAGWGGDRAVLLAPRGAVTPRGDGGVTLSPDALARTALVWTVVLDPAPRGDARRGHEDAEAVEFAEAAAAILARRYVSRPPATVPGALAARGLGDGRVSLVARVGRRVLVADRLPAADASAVVASVLGAAR